MPIEAKPLFRPDVVRKVLAYFNLPEGVQELRPELTKWAGLIESKKIDELTEKEILPDFLTAFFIKVLGYTGPADNPAHYTMSREKHVEAGGTYADAVLGIFGPTKNAFIIALEGKGPKDPLDSAHGSRKMSAVDQGYLYANNLPCDWIVITSILETRLYYKGATKQSFERFKTVALAEDKRQLEKFVYLLGAERVAPPTGRCHLYDLLATSEKVGQELTKEYYRVYADRRQDAFLRLCTENPDVPRHEVLQRTQKLLDRILFCAFCKDRGLLPDNIIENAYNANNPFNPQPIWANFQNLFRWIDAGNPGMKIEGYNGGLFAADPLLDRLKVPDMVCRCFRDLAGYDYRPAHEVALDTDAAGANLVDVEILGHIFEQSITDLEKLRNELDSLTEPARADKHKSRRKREGAFYTPNFITRYIIEQALGPVLKERFEGLRRDHENRARGAAKAALADADVFDNAALSKGQREALIRFWEAWVAELETIRLLDPACGSGAFLIAAFDYLRVVYQAAYDRLAQLRGHMELYDLDRQILEKNLYGVDLNEEAIEICKLSLWIRTAERGKTLAKLDRTIRKGNSIVADPAVHPDAFDWHAAFPEVFAAGGFDVVAGNPPYVRQEMLSSIKPYLETAYQTYHGVADLYVYFYELGMRLLKPGCWLSYVVTNKWMKAGYAEPLRRFFSEQTWIESVVDFGHAKQIFPDADVFPSILVARKPMNSPSPASARVCAIPREQLRIDDLSRQIKSEGYDVPRDRLGAEPWSLEPIGVKTLMEKMLDVGAPLSEFIGGSTYRGILTGFNEAFLLDTKTKEQLVQADPNSAPLFKKYLRGQDIDRWQAEWSSLWMLALKSSGNHAWPWSEAGEKAEEVFAAAYPALYSHLNQYRNALIKRQDQGKYWWELRACAYWDRFDKPKIMYQDIVWNLRFCLDTDGTLSNNTVYFLSTDDSWTLSALNAPISWWFAWRTAQHGKDEALRFFSSFLESFPIPKPTDQTREQVALAVRRLRNDAAEQQTGRRAMVDWLRLEFGIDKPSQKLQDVARLDADALAAEVKRARGRSKPLSVADVKRLKAEHAGSVVPLQTLAAEARTLEARVSDLVNAAYGLTPDEIALMWQTAPPRMPGEAPTD